MNLLVQRFVFSFFPPIAGDNVYYTISDYVCCCAYCPLKALALFCSQLTCRTSTPLIVPRQQLQALVKLENDRIIHSVTEYLSRKKL